MRSPAAGPSSPYPVAFWIDSANREAISANAAKSPIPPFCPRVGGVPIFTRSGRSIEIELVDGRVAYDGPGREDDRDIAQGNRS